MSIFLTVVFAILFFAIVVGFHEFGHFIFAKLFRVKVNEFSIGMGPRLFGFQGKETKYSVRLLPLGGYCAMEGEDSESSDPRSFKSAKIWKRMIIIIAGATFNIILGFFFMLLIQAQEPYYASNIIARFNDSVVTQEEYEANADNSAYYTAENENGETVYFKTAQSSLTGLQLEDEILRVNNYKVNVFDDAYLEMALDEDGVMDFLVRRNGEEVLVEGVVFDRVPLPGYDDMYTSVLDFSVHRLDKSFKTVMSQTFYEALYMIRSVYVSLGGLFTGKVGVNQLSGPVGIASMIGDLGTSGFSQNLLAGINNIMYFMAFLSINLGIVNMIPIPALDGGKFVLLLVEAIIRKPINEKVESILTIIGLLFFVTLMLFVTYQDIDRLLTSCAG